MGGRDYSPQDPIFGGGYLFNEIQPGSRQLSYTISTETLEGTRVADTYGNELQYRDDGIFSNRGRAILFERDFRGNITSITDPNGFQLRYEYDGLGRLTEFYDRRASDRLDDTDPDNDFLPTRFEYELTDDSAFDGVPNVENYLTCLLYTSDAADE